MKTRSLMLLLVTAASCCVLVGSSIRLPACIHQDFRDVDSVLTEFVNEKAPQRVNHFFVSPVNLLGTPDAFVWIYWREGRQLIKWEPFHRDQWRLGLCRSVELDKDVAPTVEEIGSSSYLVSEAWTRRVIGDCVKNGSRF
jgi:hypothetical protein